MADLHVIVQVRNRLVHLCDETPDLIGRERLGARVLAVQEPEPREECARTTTLHAYTQARRRVDHTQQVCQPRVPSVGHGVHQSQKAVDHVHVPKAMRPIHLLDDEHVAKLPVPIRLRGRPARHSHRPEDSPADLRAQLQASDAVVVLRYVPHPRDGVEALCPEVVPIRPVHGLSDAVQVLGRHGASQHPVLQPEELVIDVADLRLHIEGQAESGGHAPNDAVDARGGEQGPDARLHGLRLGCRVRRTTVGDGHQDDGWRDRWVRAQGCTEGHYR
mmetsp:Transcript_20893/g.55321  ORF Transcript_20893/g.55321 Transcript_20893/m.55321 type:complete len:275 (+) Transcript_20893:1086-1910(+)